MTLKEICASQTDLSDENIEILERLSDELPLISDLTGTDIFIDCRTRSGKVVVVYHERPSWRTGAYSENVVGQYALCKNEPAVFEALNTNAQIRDIKAVTQENRTVKQDVVPIKGTNGECIAVLIRETDVTETLLQEKKYHELSKYYEDMDASAHTNEQPQFGLIVREVNHRIKNNLQTVASMLNMQARECKDEYARGVLNESVSRVLTIATIHDMLIQSDVSQEVDCRSLLLNLKQHLMEFTPQGKRISLRVEGDSIVVDAGTANSVAVVVNELVTNAFQHAFNKQESGEITVVTIAGNLINTVVVSDNGCGFALNSCRGSFGLKIVESVIKDRLHGNLRINSDSGGTRVSFDFKTQ